MKKTVDNEKNKIIKILKVKQIGKSDNYKVTYLKSDNQEEINLPSDVIVEYRILKDKELEIDVFEKVLDSANMNKWFNKTLNFLSFKDRTIKEVKDYLEKNEAIASHIEEITNKLINMRLLNDEEYACKYLEEIIRKKKGLKYFKYQLTNKGVSSNIIEKVASNYPVELIIDELIPVIQKQQEKLYTYPINIQKQKINDKLLRDGFSSNIINQVLNKIKWTEDIKKRLISEIEKIKKQTDDESKIIKKLLSKGYTYQDIKKYLK